VTADSEDPIGPDGMVLPQVGDWAETKYKPVEIYAKLVTTTMTDKWKALAYIDLFAAAGLGQVRDTERIVPGTVICALRSPVAFDRYLVCEFDPSRFRALRMRIQRDFPGADVRYFEGDCNAIVDRVIAELPGEGNSSSVLTFCVVDPSKIADLRFSTIEALAYIRPGLRRAIDFLVLIPSHMDAHREQVYYLDPSSSALSDFLGNPSWRDDWFVEVRSGRPRNFGVFVVDEFGKSMQKHGYLWDIKDAIPIERGRQKLYHLAFFSRHPVGRKFAREARKYASPQRDLF